jgi:hypothetical protein
MNEYPRPAKTTVVKIVGGRYRNHWGWMAGDYKDFRKRCARGDKKSVVNVQVPIKGQFTYETQEVISHEWLDLAQMELDLMMPAHLKLPGVIPSRRNDWRKTPREG